MTVTRWGKRKPYVFLCGMMVCGALIWFPFSGNLLVAGVMLWLYFIFFNGCMWPFQAWLGDIVPSSKLSSLYSLQMFIGGLGASLGGIVVLIGPHIEKYFNHSTSIPFFLIMDFIVGAIIFFSATLLISLFISDQEKKQEHSTKKDFTQHLFSFAKTTAANIVNPPEFVRKIFLTQLFVWYAVYIIWVYFPLALSQNFYGLGAVESLHGVSSGQSHLLEKGTQLAGINYAIAQFAGMLFSLLVANILKKMKEGQLYCVLLIIGGVGLGVCMLFQNMTVMVIAMIGMGLCVLGPCMLMLPILALNKESAPHKRGVNFGVFNLTVAGPQILSGLTVGYLHKNLFNNNAIYTIEFAGLLIVIGALFSLRFFNKK